MRVRSKGIFSLSFLSIATDGDGRSAVPTTKQQKPGTSIIYKSHEQCQPSLHYLHPPQATRVVQASFPI